MTVETTSIANRWLVAMAAGALTLAACGGGSDPAEEVSTDSAETDSETETGTDVDSEVESEPEPASDSESDDGSDGGVTDTTVATTTTSESTASTEPDATTTSEEVDDGDDGDSGGEMSELPRFFDADTPNGRFAMIIDQSATLTLSPDLNPLVNGDAVILIDVANVSGTENNQWELRAVADGMSTISIEGTGTSWEFEVRKQ